MGLDIGGLDKLINGLAILDVDATVTKGLMRTGRRIQRAAKRLCPVDTAQLRSSIYTNETSEGVEVGASAEHAVYVEYGTGRSGETAGIGEALDGNRLSYTLTKKNVKGEYYDYKGQPPQPFLYPAVKANEGNIPKDIEYELKRAVKEAVDNAKSD